MKRTYICIFKLWKIYNKILVLHGLQHFPSATAHKKCLIANNFFLLVALQGELNTSHTWPHMSYIWISTKQKKNNSLQYFREWNEVKQKEKQKKKKKCKQLSDI